MGQAGRILCDALVGGECEKKRVLRCEKREKSGGIVVVLWTVDCGAVPFSKFSGATLF